MTPFDTYITDYKEYNNKRNLFYSEMFADEYGYEPEDWQLEKYIDQKGHDHWEAFLSTEE